MHSFLLHGGYKLYDLWQCTGDDSNMHSKYIEMVRTAHVMAVESRTRALHIELQGRPLLV